MLKDFIKKFLMKILREDLECLINQKISELDAETKDLQKRLLLAEENVRANNQCLIDISKLSLPQKLEHMQHIEDDFRKRLFMVEENVRGNNNRIETLTRLVNNTDAYSEIDYGDFENRFRGSEEQIMDRQSVYIPYFAGKGLVLDLGCGRGEFLYLLKENNIPAKGVDLYAPFVEISKEKGFDVCCDDALEYLQRCEEVDGIFAAQLVEHLSTSDLLRLCKLAYAKLSQGGCFILETPNPMSLAIFNHAFYMDPSHNKPVHPLTLQYYLELAGFSKTEILFTEKTKLPVQIPALKGEGIENLEEFNTALAEVNQQLFASQDYAIIAVK